ncbi:hypothetical protein [Streptomyces cyanogenus]|uniref:Uncharacterized protein n=1 Tax=Streptomyces cyanogenus TaxID=80860 RepID=A0ABX7U051_STRCY|nr:hypothetical protein [Streptomyces cyanogenus]QTE02408.1 hypothetical protein S1361_34070 [Streptomyces cyanogenus]
MNLEEVPYERRKLLAVDAGSSLKDLTGADWAVLAVSAAVPVVGWSIAGWQWHRRRSLGITTVTVQAARIFTFPDGGPVSGTVYAAHPHHHDSYYPLPDVHGYLLRSRVEELGVLLRSAGAGFVEIEAADTVSDHELRVALGLPLVTESGVPVGQAAAEGAVSWQRDARAVYRWQSPGPLQRAEGADPLAHPLLATEPVLHDMVKTLVDGTLARASTVLESNKDFGFTPELAARVQRQGFHLGGAFRRHTSSRLVVRVARDPDGFSDDR